MTHREARKAYRKWLAARLLARMPFVSSRFRKRMMKRERNYRDARLFGPFTRRPQQIGVLPRDPNLRTIFIDVTRASRDPKINGFNRVVGNITSALAGLTCPGFSVEFVRYDRFYQCWRRASLPGNFALAGEPGIAPRIRFEKDDIFLALDWNSGLFADDAAALREIKGAGAWIAAVIYDLIPIRKPEWFVPGFAERYRAWLNSMAGCADHLICISRAVQDELRAHLRTEPDCASKPAPPVDHFHLGCGFRPAHREYTSQRDELPTFLMVGTVEPRKGHRQALEAFRILWNRGLSVRLTIAGREGWLVEDLAAELRAARDRARLVWFTSADDRELTTLYRTSSALLAASEAEGFGLPLVEAARHRLPVLARDIPVFREILGNGAFYFSGSTAEELADAIDQWLALREEGQIPMPTAVRVLSWEESATQLMRLVLRRYSARSSGHSAAAA